MLWSSEEMIQTGGGGGGGGGCCCNKDTEQLSFMHVIQSGVYVTDHLLISFFFAR